MSSLPSPDCIARARLPRWLLPAAWPQTPDGPALADLHLRAGHIARIAPFDAAAPVPAGTLTWDLAGALVLPGLVDAHTHIDKTFTLPRMGTVMPGLLGAIEAMMADRVTWTPADVRQRASRALQWAFEAGYRRVEWKCNALNAPSRRAARRYGFAFEGIFRNHMILKSRNRDTAWYAMTDADWPALAAAYAAWLAPANFDAEGRQRDSLSDLTAPQRLRAEA